MQRDWSIYLGTAGTAPAMYPAKFTFDVTATPSCANDFVVFPVNATGSAAQPNVVAFNNLYSGTAGGTGICNSRTVPTGHTDNKASATVLWSYNVSKIGGTVTTSPVISFDATGSKIAFVESIAGQPAHFHVLAWRKGDGQASSLQNALTPAPITSFVTSAPVAGSGTATDLALGAATTGSDTLSSPFIDYTNDLAYVGNDIGVIYRIKNVFCTAGACGGSGPSFDATWGTGGALTIGGSCTGKLTGPVLSAGNSNVYVGCSDGKLYSISQTGVIKSLVVGDGVASKTYGGIVDPPIVDGVNGFVYVVSGSANNAANAVLVQAKTDLSSSVSVPIGVGNQCNMHAPTPNNAYLTNIASSSALMYVGGLSTTGSVNPPCNGGSNGSAIPTLYGAGFNATGVMKSGTPTNVEFDNFGGLGREFSPITEFFNSTTSTDWLFVSALQSNQVNFGGLNITSGFLTSANIATEGVGTSGIIVDNNASATTSPQAASVYFNALQENAACTNNTNGAATGGCAVKLTQSSLQ
ncbi:MAG TPA: hypothetical protein VMP12_09385 [Candidatus Sulfotelmatobacter sp.]|nr:hypothetical protein [Candidatus Sulfotelmatobacter sp.]